MKYKTLLLVGLASVAALVGATAQTAVTDPVGYITIDVAANNTGGSGKLTLISPSLVEKAEFSGSAAADASGSTTVTFAGTSFNFAAGAYYLEVADTGWYSTITASTATSVTLAQAVPAGNSAAKYIIRKHVTVTSFLGASNAIGLKSGIDPASADVVQFWNPTTQSLGGQYFYAGATEGVPPGWYTENGDLLGSDGVPDVPVFPGSALVVTRRPNSATSLVSVGYVKTTPTQIALVKGINIVGPLKATGTTLADSGLNTGNIATGLQQGTEPATSDTVQLTVGGTQYFAADPAVGVTGFVDENGDAAQTTNIKEGTAVIITRRPASAAVWTSPKTTVSN